ncbi:MAG: DUF6252 family protein [Gemmatimonadota bacterium]
MSPRLSLSVALAAFCLAGCGSSSSGPSDGGNTAAFSAKIDGAAWNSLAISTSAHGSANGTFTLIGSITSPTQTSMSLTLWNIGAPGTYPMGVGPTVPGGTATIVTGAQSWSTPLSGAAGTVTVTAVSATSITGTFSFVAAPVSGGATGNRTVTQGTFDLPVTSTGSVTVPLNVGSTFGGTLGGTAWNAATIVIVAAPSSGTLTIGASNVTHSINMLISGYAGVGTYTLGTGVQRTMTVFLSGTVQSWGAIGSQSTGTVTVTSATASRIKGSYTASLAPGANTTGALTLTGNFDVGLQSP